MYYRSTCFERFCQKLFATEKKTTVDFLTDKLNQTNKKSHHFMLFCFVLLLLWMKRTVLRSCRMSYRVELVTVTLQIYIFLTVPRNLLPLSAYWKFVCYFSFVYFCLCFSVSSFLLFSFVVLLIDLLACFTHSEWLKKNIKKSIYE